ncbi:hypothetical protein WJX84_012459 [Apatococcus fuscideae]|uniref:Uncharacterized protein n=1 Tax=Apatococcus fuscideae TaxID=2026836 RepID=A0AAW1TLD3_9CHLO
MKKSTKKNQKQSPMKGQGTLLDMYRSKHAKSTDGQLEARIACEIPCPSQSDIQIRISTTSLKNMLAFYTEGVSTKRKHARCPASARNVRLRRDPSSSDEPTSENQLHTDSIRSGDDDGQQYIAQLEEFVELGDSLTQDHLKEAIQMVRQHGLHDLPETSHKAFSMLLEHLRRTPTSRVSSSSAPKVESLQASWNIMGSNTYPKDVFISYPPDQVALGHHEVTGFELLKRLVAVASLATQGWNADVARTKDLSGMTAKQGHGELLLLKFIVAGFQQDLRARLAVYSALCKGQLPEAVSTKRSVLLQFSLLWRMISVGNKWHDDMTPLLRNLVEIIMGSGVLPAGGSQTPGKTPNKRRSSDVLGLEDEAGQTLLEASVWTQAELAATASVLLNLFYELLGHMEEDGLAHHNNAPKAGTSRAMHRQELDKHLAGMLKGSNVLTKDVSRIQRLLLSLRARDSLRLIAVLFGRPHPRKGRENNFDCLELLHNVTFEKAGETFRYTSASVLDILGYLADEARRGNLTKVLPAEMGSEGTALLITASAQAALRCLRSGQLHHCFTAPLPSSKEEALLSLQEAFDDALKCCIKSFEDLSAESGALITGCRWCLKAAMAAC